MSAVILPVEAKANRIVEAMVAMMGTIQGGAKFLSNVRNVGTGLTVGDIEGGDRPMIRVLDGPGEREETAPIGGGGPLYQTTADVTIYAETADADDAGPQLTRIVRDIKRVVREMGRVVTSDAPEGLCVKPLKVREIVKVIDLSGNAGIGSARITVEATYRTTGDAP